MKVFFTCIIMCFCFCACGANPTSPTSNYPANYDTDAGTNGTLPLIQQGDALSINWANRIRNSIDSIERELGTNPSSSASTLSERFDAEHDENGRHRAFETDEFQIGSETTLRNEPTSTYNNVSILFGNQYTFTDAGTGGPIENSIKFNGATNRFEFSNDIFAPNLPQYDTTNTFTKATRIGASDYNPSVLANGHLYIGTNSVSGDDTVFDIYSSTLGLSIRQMNPVGNSDINLTTLLGPINVNLRPVGTNAASTLNLYSTGAIDEATGIFVSMPSATEGNTENEMNTGSGSFQMRAVSDLEFNFNMSQTGHKITFTGANTYNFDNTVAVGGVSSSGSGASLRTSTLSASTYGYINSGLNVGSSVLPSSAGYFSNNIKIIDATTNAAFKSLNLQNATIRTDHPILRLPNKASDPTTDNQTGDMYFKSDTGEVRLYNGTGWVSL